MHLASNDSRREDGSETVPILSESHNAEEPQESTCLCEIRTVDGDTLVANDTSYIDDDETCGLVNSDQSQCRICLDSEGLYRL